MYIKTVVIDGFKSYAQRTEVSGFDRSFNAITGLNGSGKSNILDSICFLLGISNLLQVRASSLQELVYKGGQAGVTKATVTVTFDNHDKKQSPLGYESYDEFTVSRQIVIGGKEKYLINGSNANPRTVKDLFRSVQLNVNNPHFLIMQGRITKVLNMKPPEILSMIEEAAGTRMYESKKISAQKTIEKKDNKLKEIEVILSEEITPTLKRLKDERSSYLEFQKVTREVEQLSRFSIAYQFVQDEKHSQQTASELEEMKAGMEEVKEQIEAAEAAIEDISSAASKLEKEKSAVSQGPILSLEKKTDEAAKAKAVSEATLKHCREALAALRKRCNALQKALQEDQSLHTANQAHVAEGLGAYEALQAHSKAAEAAVLAAQQHFQAVTAGLSSGAGGQEETLAAQKIACENAISEAVTVRKQAEMRLDSARTELNEKGKSCKNSGQAYGKDKEAWDATQKEIKRIEQLLSKLSYKEGLEENLQAKRDELQVDGKKLKEKVEMLEARFPQVQFKYQDPHPNFNHDAVKGPLAKLVRVKDVSTATALEVTAGGKLFNIVVDTEEIGKDLLNKGRLKKRYTIIPLNRIAAKSISNDVIKRAQSLVGKTKARAALSLVGYDDELRPAMEYVFGSTFVCDTLETAKKVTFDQRVLKRSVSLSGDVFDPSGTLTGGSRSNAASVLAKLGELCEAEALLQQREAERREVERELQSIQGEATKFRKMTEHRDSKTHEAEIIMTRMKQSTHHQQLTELKKLEDTISEQNAILSKTLDAEKASKTQLEDIQRKMKDSKSHHEREMKSAEEGVSRTRKEAESIVKEASTQQQTMQTLQLEVEEMEKSLSAQQDQIDSGTEAIAKKTEELAELVGADNKAKDKLQAAKKALEEGKAGLRERNKELQKCEQERKKREKEKTECALKIKEYEHSITKFHKDSRDAAKRVEAMLAKYEWIATDRQFFGQPNTAYDFSASDVKEVTRRLAKLQEQKDKLSKSVNMRAMNMLGKAEEKYNDLIKKKGIVQKDKEKITELIAELDQKKNETLLGAYERVNKDFGSIFSTLLPGTNAKLLPPEGLEILDGLEVKVAFGTVWKDSLQELSGGQRSLVALSLILALLLFKPAPVYILDEVDAALDLSHTQNIGQMLRTHFAHSQFIVVSLKDGMFNNANVLFKTKFVDGVSTVTRYVNPKLSTLTALEEAEDGQSLRKRAIAASHKTKKARMLVS